ncbi:MAG: hypothetical protein LBQ79_02015 [Deltaproteobacteria bacterium]|jgi:tRNA pseudouridine55 synthase|nr:hypothetical protein [Deltaproteobacteria bacterium]
MTGLVFADKPKGAGTFSLTRAVRKIVGLKTGHVGTLDPNATGLVGILVGSAVKLLPLVVGMEKVYSGTMRLGLVTDTLDVTGETLSEHGGPFPELPAVREALEAFLGTRPQRPPAFSAVKVGGRPSYRDARAGRAADPLPERPAFMRSCEILGWAPPLLNFRIGVGCGFYVRSLANDLGAALGLGGGALQELRRESLGPFGLDLALEPPFSLQDISRALLGFRHAVPDVPEYRATPEESAALGRGGALNGGTLSPERIFRLPGQPDWPAPRGGYPAGTVVVTCGGRPVAIGEYSGPGGPPAPRGAGPDGNGGPDSYPSRPRGPFLRPLRVLQPPAGQPGGHQPAPRRAQTGRET